MTSFAPDTDQPQELDAETRQAWATYSEQLRELTGQEYEQAESESWEALQGELRRLEKERESIAISPAQLG
jgi:predicted phage gp36 major capsid-like protein